MRQIERLIQLFAISSLIALVCPTFVATADDALFVRPYVMVGEIDGDLKTQGIATDFSLGWGNAFEKGNGAVGLDVEGRIDRFVSLTEGWYTALGDVDPPISDPTRTASQQSVETIFVSQKFGVAVVDTPSFTFDLLAGARFASVSNELTLRVPGSEEVLEQSETWVDPLVGIASRTKLADSVSLRFGGDVGGFGAGSDLTWQGQMSLGLRIAPRGAFSIGYRALAHSYEKQDFQYDLVMRGPTLGMEFSF